MLFIATLKEDLTPKEIAQEVYDEFSKRYKQDVGELQEQMHGMLHAIAKADRKIAELNLRLQYVIGQLR